MVDKYNKNTQKNTKVKKKQSYFLSYEKWS
jgi:hypothetical protein